VQTLEEASKKTSDEQEREVTRLESLLHDRGQQIQTLEGEVARRDKLVREMVAGGMLGRTDAPANGREATADLTARLDHMAGEAAQREADLVAARWRIAQLERERTQTR
jgi:hypothetical protein